MKKLPFSLIPLILFCVPTSAQLPYSQLRPSSNYWDRSKRNVPVRITHISGNRKLATVGDNLYMLDARNRVVWTWSTRGAGLTDLPVELKGTIYAIGYDLIWVGLDSSTGKKLWTRTANGNGAVYSQLGLYKRDMYFVVTSMEGYRDRLSDRRIKDHLEICRDKSTLWEGDIPVGSRIEIDGNRVIAVQKRNGRVLRKLIKVPLKLSASTGKVSSMADWI